MKKEELLKLKEKISQLSDEEKKLRDNYLRDITLGKIYGPMTGYSSIDMPSLQYYNMSKYYEIVKQETVPQALLRQNKDNLEGNALEFFFSNIKYKKFFEKGNELVKALSSNGISKGDYVTIISAGIPESMEAIYSLGYLGAVGIYMPPYLETEKMIRDINHNNSKILIIMSLFYDQIKYKLNEVVANSSIEQVVVLPTLNSSILGNLTKEKKYDGTIQYNDFIKNGQNCEMPKMVEYEPDMPLAIVYSSGTTGDLKGVTLTHDTFNNSASSYLAFGFNLQKGQRIYQAIPVWSSTGLIADGMSALYYGCTLFQNPQFDSLIYSKNLGLHKLNWGIATTELFNGLLKLQNDKKFQLLLKLGIVDYKKLENAYIGGTFSTPKDRKRLNDVLESLGCKAKIRASYGTCENGSIVTAELNGINHPDYSVGIPIPGVSIIAIDEDYNELPYYQRGELVVKTNCGMLGYYNRPELNKVFIKDQEGLDGYKHTGDIGYVLPTGDIIYEGRANDTSIVDDKIIYNFDVKKAILSDDCVFDCEVFTNQFENVLCANIVFYENAVVDNISKIKELQQKIYDCYGDLSYVPEMFKIRTEFPMASSTKRDFKALKAEQDGYIFVSKNHINKNLIRER